jgi:glutaminyl-peptide cyclotransferase
LRNVISVVPGRDPKDVVVVGAHYDTKDIPGFLGANDGAGGTAVVMELARHLTPDTLHPTIVFALFDGEESPDDTPDSEFEQKGLRGSKVAARAYSGATAMILLDFVGIPDLSIPREESSDVGLWARLRESARRVGAEGAFPPGTGPDILDDHTPFEEVGVPSVDLIDFDYPCFHELCDDLSHVSEKSLNEVGETVRDLLPRL